MLCCGYTLTDFPISIRLTSLALWQSNDCPSASKATLMNMDKYFMWIHYERLHNHNKAKHNKTVCTFLGMYCMDANGIEAWTNPRSLDETFWCILLKDLSMIQYSHKFIFINICLIIGRPRDNQTALVQSVAWDKRRKPARLPLMTQFTAAMPDVSPWQNNFVNKWNPCSLNR